MRAYFLDRIRVILTVLVIAHHSAITYGASGSWFIKLAPADNPTSLALSLFVAINQAFVIGFFFLIAGYLTPSSFDRKGSVGFTHDRLLRLGVPTLVFGFVVGPLTVAIAQSEDWNLLRDWIALMGRLRFVIGPMWFAYALLLFSLAYVLWRRFVPVTPGRRKPVPGHIAWILSALGVGAAALAIRQVVPVGEDVLNLQLGYFASYTFLFATGCIAERYGWLEAIKRRHALPWMVAATLAIPLLPAAMLAGEAIGQADFRTGLSLPSVVYALWEPIVAWGVIAGSLWLFQMKWGERDRRWGFLSRLSYGAFILHPPVIVALARVMEPMALPVLASFGILTALGTTIAFIVAWSIRKLPGVREVV